MSETVNRRIIISFFYITDPQNEAKVTSDQHGAHTDWLTLNIGGRPFTTTRYLCPEWVVQGFLRWGGVLLGSYPESVLCCGGPATSKFCEVKWVWWIRRERYNGCQAAASGGNILNIADFNQNTFPRPQQHITASLMLCASYNPTENAWIIPLILFFTQ